MPKNKIQGFIFGIIMSYAMAYGMEIYNVAIKLGVNLTAGGFSNMTNLIFWEALKEASYMGLFVLLFSNLWGNRIGASFASKHCDPSKDSPYICQLPAIWVGTFFKNFPMAFFWNMFAAAPFTHWLFKKIFHQA